MFEFLTRKKKFPPMTVLAMGGNDRMILSEELVEDLHKRIPEGTDMRVVMSRIKDDGSYALYFCPDVERNRTMSVMFNKETNTVEIINRHIDRMFCDYGIRHDANVRLILRRIDGDKLIYVMLKPNTKC
jgi:hypothetical protein